MRPTLIPVWLLVGLTVVLVGFVAFVALRPAAIVNPSAVQTVSTIPYSIVVDGTGEGSAPPDVAYVTLGVDTTASTATEATENNATAMASVIAAVKERGIPDRDVRTEDFSVTPVYASQRPGETAGPTITGYRVRNTARITVEDVKNVGTVLDTALRATANRAVGVSFAIKDSTALQQQALKDAMHQAQAKAQSIAASAGLRLTGPYTITESSTQPPRPIVTAQAAAAAPAATPIESGQLTVTSHVQVTFQYAH